MPAASEISNKNVWGAIALAVITSITSLGTALITKDKPDDKSIETLGSINERLGALTANVKNIDKTLDKLEKKIDKNTIRSVTAYAALSRDDMMRSEGIMGAAKAKPSEPVYDRMQNKGLVDALSLAQQQSSPPPPSAVVVPLSEDEESPKSSRKKKKAKRKMKKTRAKKKPKTSREATRKPASIESPSAPSHLDKSLLTLD